MPSSSIEIVILIFSIGAILAILALSNLCSRKTSGWITADSFTKDYSNLSLKDGANASKAVAAVQEAAFSTTSVAIPFLRNRFAEKKESITLSRDGGNNCLFEASLNALKIDWRRVSPQMLRNACDIVLKEEGLPIIPRGHMAGEQYIQALSKIFSRRINVYKRAFGPGAIPIKHEDVPDDAPSFSIKHLGHQEAGHWVATSEN
jgi:hypothetical protein